MRRLGVAASLLFIALMTLRPAPAFPPLPPLCIVCGSLGGVDFVLNVALFVPLGASLAWLTGRWPWAVLCGLVVTIAVEAMQWRLIPGRDASIGDVISNTLGAALGAWIAVRLPAWWSAAGEDAERYARWMALVVATVLLGSAALLRPADPRIPTQVQWLPQRDFLDPYTGTLEHAELNGHGLFAAGPARLVEDAAARVRNEIHLQVTAPAVRSTRPAHILRLAWGPIETLMVGQDGDALTFRSWQVANRARLRPLLVGLPHTFGDSTRAARAPLTVDIRTYPRGVDIQVTGPFGMRRAHLRRTASLAWTMLLPRELAVDGRFWPVNAAWLGSLFLPLGFLVGGAARGARHRRPRILHPWWPILAAVLALVAGSRLTEIAMPGPTDWAGVVAGVGAGLLLGRRRRLR